MILFIAKLFPIVNHIRIRYAKPIDIISLNEIASLGLYDDYKGLDLYLFSKVINDYIVHVLWSKAQLYPPFIKQMASD